MPLGLPNLLNRAPLSKSKIIYASAMGEDASGRDQTWEDVVSHSSDH